MHIVLPLLALTTTATAWLEKADLCFFKSSPTKCSFIPGTISTCCFEMASGECCEDKSKPEFCGFMSGEQVGGENAVVNFYKKDTCTGLFDACDDDDRLDGRGNCCSKPWDEKLKWPDGEGKLETCSVRWMKKVDLGKGEKVQGRGDGGFTGQSCREPDVVRYVDKKGVERLWRVPKGKMDRVVELVQRGEWEALEEYVSR